MKQSNPTSRSGHSAVRLYNVIFPIALLILFPATWIIVLPANFLIDSLVLFGALLAFRVPRAGKNWMQAIWKTWILGFVADLVACGILLLGIVFDRYDTPLTNWLADHVFLPACINPYQTWESFVLVVLVVAFAGWLIYLFNRKYALRNTELSDVQKRRVALTLAILTAPYVLFVPTVWMK
ncbi:MAG: hypothetical protein Q4A52_03425 [Bacillota bacterium]|nr:hypothetical protein [Bacillota bacterium]